MVGILPLQVGITTVTGGHKTGISKRKGFKEYLIIF
jgi:hypothetical protein